MRLAAPFQGNRLAMSTWLWLLHWLWCLLLLNVVDLDHMVYPLNDAHFFRNDSLKFFYMPHLLALQDLPA